MWIKFGLFVAILCNTFTQVPAWSIDASCYPVQRNKNMKNVVNYIMQWPEKVNTALGSDATVNTFAKNLFNEPDFGTVKKVINDVGAMSKEDTSGTDPIGPIIYCDQNRVQDVEDPTDPSKTILKDTTHDIIIPPDHFYHDCLTGNKEVLAFTEQWTTNDGKRHIYIQLCKPLLDDFGQSPTFNGMEFKVKQMNGAAEYMAQMRKAPVHIDNFMPFYVTMFHEFVHAVQDPEVEDSAGTGWRNCISATEAKALDNADSYAFTALGAWILSTFGATISNQGIIQFDKYKDPLKKREELVGLPWFA